MLSGVNRSMNRFIRRTLYSLKRQYGGRVDVYQLGSTDTDYETGDKTYTRSMITVPKCIVLPVKIQREAVQSISVISANKSFVYGGTYDAGSRMFIIDARDLPADYEIVNDDWLVYNNRRYDIKDITEFEQHTGWIITGREVKGVMPEQIWNMRVKNEIALSQGITTVLAHEWLGAPGSTLSIVQEVVANLVAARYESLSSVASFLQVALGSRETPIANPMSIGQVVVANLVAGPCAGVDWTLVGAAYWAGYQTCINSKLDQSGSDSTATFGSLAGSSKWWGGVLAPNGFIYGIPFVSTSVLKINPSANSASTFGSLAGSTKWLGGVLAPNGFIYGIPFSSSSVLKLDPSDDSTSTFGTVSNGPYYSGVLAGNGCIYCVPNNGTTVLKIDTSDDSVSEIGTLPATSSKWRGAVLGVNGMIYGIPGSSTTILRIDPSDDSMAEFGSLSGANKWLGGVLAANGHIYGIPFDSTQVLKIDTSSDTPTVFGSLSGGNKWRGGVLAPNGFIYGIPRDSTSILKIDPSGDTAATFGSFPGASDWSGGILAPNGHLYGVPYSSSTVLRIEPDSASEFTDDVIQSAYFNKF